MQNIQQVLLHAHLEEIARKDAAAWNIGWYRSVNRIESKTDKGILVSKINLKSKTVSHKWHSR